MRNTVSTVLSICAITMLPSSASIKQPENLETLLTDRLAST